MRFGIREILVHIGKEDRAPEHGEHFLWGDLDHSGSSAFGLGKAL